MVVLGARQVEGDHTAVLVGDRELRHLEGRLGRDVPDAADDDVRLDAEFGLALVQALEDRFDHLGQTEPFPGVEHGGVANLHVPDVLRSRVGGELVGDAPKRVLGLHHPERDVEGLEVLDERAGVLAQMHRAGEAIGVGRGEVDSVLFGQLEDGREAEGTVEVNVQIRLREPLEVCEGQRHR